MWWHAPGFLKSFLFMHQYVYVCMCACVSVCLPPRPLITSGVIWRDIGHVWLVKPILQLFSLLPLINWMGIVLVTQCVVHARQRFWNWRCTSHRRRRINYLPVATRWSTSVIKVSKMARLQLHSNSFGLKSLLRNFINKALKYKT